MGLKFYVSEVQGQINDAVRVKNEGQQAVEQLQSSISQFLSAPLSGKAYTSAKNYFQVAYTPLCRAAIMSGEALVSAHRKLLSEYQSTVGSIDTDEDQLREHIANLEEIQRDLERQINDAKTMRPDLERRYINAGESIKKVQERIDKLIAYDIASDSFFEDYHTCQSQYNSGLAQVQDSKAWNPASCTFDLSLLDMSWAVGINEQWKEYQDRQHGIDEKKNEELAKYNIYAVVYYDIDGNPQVSWKIEDKDTGYCIQNTSLYRYLQKTGSYLDPSLIQFITYEAYDAKVKDAWRHGVNYVTGEKLNPVLGGIVSVAQYGEDGITWLNENELGQAIQLLGFAYASYRMTTTSGTKNVKIKEKTSGADGVGNPVEVVGKGNTGRIEPNTLSEQMAMHEVKSNPLKNATELPFKMKDTRWSFEDGWVKMQNNVKLPNGDTVSIHYVYNKKTGLFDDFKFK